MEQEIDEVLIPSGNNNLSAFGQLKQYPAQLRNSHVIHCLDRIVQQDGIEDFPFPQLSQRQDQRKGEKVQLSGTERIFDIKLR